MHPRIHSVFPTWLLVFGLLAAFVGERAYGADETMRPLLAAICGLALIAAAALRASEHSRAEAAKKPVSSKLLLTTLGVGAALASYALIPLAFTDDSPSHERLRGVLWAIWPTLLSISLFPLIAIELAVQPVAYIPSYERARVLKSYQRGLALALFLACLVVGNFLADRHETKWELSAGHQAVASDQTERAVRDLTKPVEVVLFYPRANEVAERIERYFTPLARANPSLTVTRIDHALAGDRAKGAKVTENGYVAVFQGKVSEKIRVGSKARAARSALRRFDANFLKALVKVTTSKKVAYFTSGHGERATQSPDKEDERTPLKLLKKQLEAWQYTIKELSVANGLADKIPDDAGLILIMGPRKEFLDAELETLKAATERGARILVALDAGPEAPKMQGLLSALGLELDTTALANEQKNAPLTRTPADRRFIYSNRFSSHASVTTLTRNARRLATVFDGAASLRKVDGALPRVKTEMVAHSVDGTFADLDADLAFDADREKKVRYELAAAVTRTSTTGDKDDESRVFVLSDVDVFGDKLVKLVEGNILLFRDVIIWLKKDAEPVAPTISEDDVKIVHRKEDDSLLFYGTTFGLPALVVLVGWLANRRRRR